MITNYNNTPMSGITERDYETLLCHLSEQVAATLLNCPDGEAIKAARDALTNTWDDVLTVRGWLAAAGSRMGTDTSECVGA